MTAPASAPSLFDVSLLLDVVARRDGRFDGLFVYAVKTTGVYCNPSCPSRSAKPQNMLFFPTAAAAAAAGFGPCRRCRPDTTSETDPDALLVASGCRLLQQGEERLDVPSLAFRLGVSPHRLHQAYKRVLKISPAEYARQARSREFKALLRAGEPIASAAYGAGYSSISQVYGKAVEMMGMTPRTYRNGGAGMRIEYGIAGSDFGYVLAAKTDRGVCAVHFGDTPAELEALLLQEFPTADVVKADDGLHVALEAVLASLNGQKATDLSLDVQGTAFQRRVWDALRAIPFGQTATYAQLAASVGSPKATRAVGGACASNQVAVLIPCHRAVPADGGSGGYRWGRQRKAALLEHERRAAQTQTTHDRSQGGGS